MSTEQIQGYMRLAEQRIGAAFVADGLYIHMAGAWQGPHTISFGLRLYEPRAGNIQKALKLGPALEAAVGASPVRVYSDQGVIFVELPSPWPQVVPGAQLRGQRLAVPLGLTPRKTVAGIDFDANPHVLAVGPTNKGKSTAMRAIAYHLARQNPAGRVAMVAMTFKPDDWKPVGKLVNGWSVVADPGEALQALVWLRDRMIVRTRSRQSSPEIFVFVDDLANLLGSQVDCGKPLLEIASMGRAAGIHLVIGTQRLGQKGAGDALIASNITTRLVFSTASAADAAFYTGRGGTGAEKIGAHPGDALLVEDGGAQRLAVGFVSDADFAALHQQPAELRPWRGAPVRASAEDFVGDEKRGLAPGAPVQMVQTGLLLQRPPTAEDAAELRRIFEQEKRNKNAVYRACGVVKNPLRAFWLSQSLEGSA